MNPSWQVLPSASIIAPLLSVIAIGGAGSKWLAWAQCGIHAALLAGVYRFAPRGMPKEYLKVATLVSMAVGLVWLVGTGLLAGEDFHGWTVPSVLDAALSWSSLALCLRFSARWIWFVPGGLPQPGWRIILTGAGAAAVAQMINPGMIVWRHFLPNGWGYIDLPAFLVAQLMLQVGLTPWLIDKRRLAPVRDPRPVWLFGTYLVLEMALMAGN